MKEGVFDFVRFNKELLISHLVIIKSEMQLEIPS